MALAGLMMYAAAFLLLEARSDVPGSRLLIAGSATLGISLAILPVLLERRRWWGFGIPVVLLLGAIVRATAGPTDLIPLRVELGTRSLSKLPFLLALDQGLYEKHGLDVQLYMPPTEFEGGVDLYFAERPEQFDIKVDGQTPMMLRMATDASYPPRISLAGVDCIARTHIIGRHGLNSLEELEGKRLGISRWGATAGFVGLLAAQRMGWDPVHDISLMELGRNIEALREGWVDAIVANERNYAFALMEGFPILADTRTWDSHIAGNSVTVEPEWLEDPTNREAARRFLRATVEAIARFHQDRELALRILAEWNGIVDREFAEIVYSRGAWFQRVPYPCYGGIEKTMELYDSNEMRRYEPEEFYDDTLMRELAASGFIDSLYVPR